MFYGNVWYYGKIIATEDDDTQQQEVIDSKIHSIPPLHHLTMSHWRIKKIN